MMKSSKIFIAVFCTFFLIGISLSSGQMNIRKGVKVGYNWSSLRGDGFQSSEPIKAITGGVSLELSFFTVLILQTDLMYSPQGINVHNGDDIDLKYLSLPIFIKFKLPSVAIIPYFLGGLKYDFLLSAKQGGNDIKDNISPIDLSVMVGGGIEFSFLGKALLIEGRYSYGIKSIYKEDIGISSHNSVAQLCVGFLL